MKATLLSLLSRFPQLRALLKRMRNRLSRPSGVSSHYVPLKNDEAAGEAARLRDAWQSDALPRRQRELVDGQLAAYRRGEHIDVFDVMSKALRRLPSDVRGLSVLEVGCSSGFYSEVFDIAGLGVRYAGCDYSAAFIALARQTYPSLRFDVETATALNYEDNAFDVVISGCCLLHIPEYTKGVAETARVARRYAIFHRTPVVWGQPEQWYRKQAYGVETVEIHFNEPEFLTLLDDNGFELIATYTLSEESIDTKRTKGNASRTYVCRKKNQ